MKQLELVLGELGITQYLGSFVDQGFDTWETVLDITEADLDQLGVKLGHRRKLQRRIANTRAISADILPLGPTKRPISEETRPQDVHHQEAPKLESRENGNLVITKRKYRRHPKPDENAPERPPSAYVLFSNKMREDLKGRNLTFTEIAKLVGENWQSLSAHEKEPFESQAQALKDKYQADLAEYRKTPEFKKYQAYLTEFKAKHAPSSQDKEASKRVKLSEHGGMSGSSTNATPNRTSRSGSGSSHRGSEPPPSRHQRLDSTVSAVESQNSTTMTSAPYHHSTDDIADSPKTVTTDVHSERSPTFSTSPTEPPLPFSNRRDATWPEDQRMDQRSDHASMHRPLPSFADVFDSPGRLPSMGHAPDVNGFPFPRTHASPGPPPGLINGENRPPQFKHEQSSGGGSTSSSASSFGYPRTPTDGPLPIHALLASKPHPHPFELSQHQQAIFQPHPSSSIPTEHKQQQPPAFSHHGPNGIAPSSMMNGYQRESSAPHAPVITTTPAATKGLPQPEQVYGGPPHTHPPSHQQQHNLPAPVPNSRRQQDAKLDGMSALLKAGEIVDRRAH